MTLQGKRAIVTGGSSGVGKATVQALISRGVQVTAVARDRDRLRALEAGGAATFAGDASDPAVAERLLRDVMPDLVVLAAGIQPPMGSIVELDWAQFSRTWNVDLQATFHFLKLAHALPLQSGSTIVTVSSGAAVDGSPLSGGYAGAKRMQWLLAGYAQRESDRRKLGIRTIAVVPRQLITGTAIAESASSAYAAANGITAAQFMARFPVPLDAAGVAAAIVGALDGEVAAGVTAIAVTGSGITPI